MAEERQPTVSTGSVLCPGRQAGLDGAGPAGASEPSGQAGLRRPWFFAAAPGLGRRRASDWRRAAGWGQLPGSGLPGAGLNSVQRLAYGSSWGHLNGKEGFSLKKWLFPRPISCVSLGLERH